MVGLHSPDDTIDQRAKWYQRQEKRNEESEKTDANQNQRCGDQGDDTCQDGGTKEVDQLEYNCLPCK